MKKSFKLSETELQILDILWQLPEPSSLKEIMDFLNERLNKSCKQQTVGTYLPTWKRRDLSVWTNALPGSICTFLPVRKKNIYKAI